MAEYILQDKDKAAFINRMNKILSQIGPGLGIDQSSFVDVPETEDEDKCIYVAESSIEERIVDSLIDKNVFSYKIKKINISEMLREIKKEYIDEASRLQKLAGIVKEEVNYVTNIRPEGSLGDIINVLVYNDNGNTLLSLEVYSSTGRGMAQINQLRKRTSAQPMEDFTSDYVLGQMGKVYDLGDKTKQDITQFINSIPSRLNK
jgi:hypothetical protein